MNEDMNDLSDIGSDVLERSFREYSSLELDSSLSFLYDLDETSKHPVTVAANLLLHFQAEHNISNRAVVQMAEIHNEAPDCGIEIPLNEMKINKRANMKYHHEYYIFCEKCGELTKCNEKCEQCNILTGKSSQDFLAIIPVEQQIKLSLKRNFAAIIGYLNKDQKDGMISDIYDGRVYKKIESRIPNSTILSLTINMDGASISNSSKTSIWPILLYQNFLPPKMRFMKENILLAGVICTKTKSDLSKLILPLIIEMNHLFKERISLIRDSQIHHFIPFVMFCLCDLPARAEIQQIKYVSGYYSCPVCLQKGSPVKNSNEKKTSTYVRYIKTSEKPMLRTHEQTINDTRNYLMTNEVVNGIKGLTPLIGLPCFNIIDCVSTDYMHGVRLGVMNLMIDIWFGSKVLKNVKPGFKLKMEDRMKLNKKIVQLKPCSRITRKPRSLFDRSFYKAIEYRNLLWYYLHYALYGLLNQAAINHFDLLSAATYTLNKAEVSIEEITEAGKMLEKFADDFEQFYGRDSVTMNIHMLHHYANNVLNCGPLWSHSMFGFESRIGDFKKCQRSKVHISESIVKKYCLSDLNRSEPGITDEIEMLREKPIVVDIDIAAVFAHSGFLPLNADHIYIIAYETRMKNEIFKSLGSHVTRSIDHFVKMKDETVGAIELFVKHEMNCYALIKKYEIVHRKYHLNEVKLTKPLERQLYNCCDISEKLIYLKFNNIEVLTKEPNRFEKT